MEESFLHYVWQYGKFDHTELVTTLNEPIRIGKRGFYNHDSGPDFFNAKIGIGEMDWVGNVEIHVKASDWNRHNHSQDPAYFNTILHVVFEYDAEIRLPDGRILPTLELKYRIPNGMYEKFQLLKSSIQSIPCASLQPASTGSSVITALNRSLADRLTIKSDLIFKLAAAYNNDWQTVFYITMAKYLGNRVNDPQMETLARSTPLRMLSRIADDPFQVEAVLFGQSGMLVTGSKDPYQKKLHKEYLFLCNKHQFQPMPISGWKFMRMRPAGFPTIRIAQLAALVAKGAHLFSAVLEETDPEKLKELFSATASEYWDTHYRFGHNSPVLKKSIGGSTLAGLLINAVAPALFAYGMHQQSDVLKERAFDLLDKTEPEDNKITRSWEQLGFQNRTAYDSQALTGLWKLYCEPRKCIDCAIGQRLIRG